ncbi:hypothetical protein SPFM15_00118 [Salmonella phage SPFM15]|nr:hypothetical protein SPFM5_00113 [Salmonella phage SPFM5]VFR13742.1 hypothetical protein SPFM15_00118 [Salmonella phage SPFM15]
MVKQQFPFIHFIECDITWLHVDVRTTMLDTPLQKVHDYIAANPNGANKLYAESGSMHKFGNAFDVRTLQFFINQEKPKGGDWQTQIRNRFGRMVILTSSQQQRSPKYGEGAIRFLNPLLLISLQLFHPNPANFALKELMPQEYIVNVQYLNIKRAFLTAP